MLNVYIVRHGETDTNKVDAINGSRTNLPLNENGIKQAEALRESFDIDKIDYVYASPLLRAKQTAEILANGKRNIIYDDRLKEMDYGNWDGVSTEYLHKNYPQVFDELGYFKENYTKYCTGESYRHLSERVSDFWNELVQKHENESIVLVFHGTASRALVRAVLQTKEIVVLGEIQNGGVVNVSVDDKSKKAFLRYYNRVAPCSFSIKKRKENNQF